jgi:rhomboid protease GluP
MRDNTTTEWDDWVQVGRYPSLEQAYDHGLVILAMGEACRVAETPTPGEYDLQAEALPAAKISAELDAYRLETNPSDGHRGMSPIWRHHSPGYALCGIWMLTLIVTFYFQEQDASLIRRGASSSLGLFEQGEWWRPLSALFLHTDPPHLVGNLVAGMLFSTWVSRTIGPLLGWSMILACGALGNLTTAWIAYPEPFTSIGASTAVFAALGILSGAGAAESFLDRARLPWLRVLAPVLAGVVLLGLIGGGNSPHTDVLGHIFGFSSGLAAGFPIHWFSAHKNLRA